MFAQEPKGRPEATSQQRTATSKGESAHVAEARVQAQHAKLEMQEQEPIQQHVESTHQQAKGNRMQRDLQAQPSVMTTVARAIEDYLQDHQAGNHSAKTLEWHQIALELIQTYLEQECEITLIDEIKSSDISGWFAHMRTIPGKHGKPRAEHTIQTYARSARAFFHWLIRRHIIESNPFDGVTFPKVGKRQIETVELEEFEQLLLACAPPNEPGPLAQRAAARNRAIFWLFYDTGIRVSELCSLKVDDVDRKHAMITIRSKGSKERRIALGKSCLSSLLHYLDRHRSDKQEQAEWDSAGEDHLFLSETQTPLTENGVEMLFRRVRERAGITDKPINPHIFRHTFAIRYLALGNDPLSLQELLGYEDITTIKDYYVHMNDEAIQEHKRKYSPGDHLPTRMPGSRQERRRGFQVREKDERIQDTMT